MWLWYVQGSANSEQCSTSLALSASLKRPTINIENTTAVTNFTYCRNVSRLRHSCRRGDHKVTVKHFSKGKRCSAYSESDLAHLVQKPKHRDAVSIALSTHEYNSHLLSIAKIDRRLCRVDAPERLKTEAVVETRLSSRA